MAASPPLLVLPLLGSGNKGVKRDAKAAGKITKKGEEGAGWWGEGWRRHGSKRSRGVVVVATLAEKRRKAR